MKSQSYMHTGSILPINEPNVDTDKIIPADFLTTLTKKGLGKHLFDRVRKENSESYPLDSPYYNGELYKSASNKGATDKGAAYKKESYKRASILLCRPNFGCGSSREHAAWAIRDAGFKVLIGTTFLDIFLNNCQLNGIWVIKLREETVNRLFDMAPVSDMALKSGSECKELSAVRRKKKMKEKVILEVDMKNSEIHLPWGVKVGFEIDPFYREIFMNGVDPINFVGVREKKVISLFEKKKEKFPKGVFVLES